MASKSRSNAVKDGERCYWCGRMMRPKTSRIGKKGRTPHPAAVTREHLIPRAHGGGNGANIVTACSQCNGARGTDTRWVAWTYHGGHLVASMPTSQWLHLTQIRDRAVQGRPNGG